MIFSAASSERLATSCADLAERLLGRLLDLALRLLETALAVLLGLLAHALALDVGDLARLGEDRLGLALRLADQLAMLLEQALRASSRARSASSIVWRMRSRRSSIIFWIGPKA